MWGAEENGNMCNFGKCNGRCRCDESPAGSAEKRRWYFVCRVCNAKWFASDRVNRCPRCGTPAVATEKIVPPWCANGSVNGFRKDE